MLTSFADMRHVGLLAGVVLAASDIAVAQTPSRTFQWDNGHGAFPFKPGVMREYTVTIDYPTLVGNILRKVAASARSEAGPGEATAVFDIGRDGRIKSLQIVSSSSPAHAAMLRSLFAGLRAPPPPGGYFRGLKSFAFR